MGGQIQGASPNTYTLQDAARELGVTVKTLGRWIDIEGLHPTEDPRDRRRRLITGDELSRLKQTFGEVPPAGTSADDIESRVAALEEQAGLLETALAALSARAAAMGDNIISLTQQVLELQSGHEASTKAPVPVTQTRSAKR